MFLACGDTNTFSEVYYLDLDRTVAERAPLVDVASRLLGRHNVFNLWLRYQLFRRDWGSFDCSTRLILFRGLDGRRSRQRISSASSLNAQ